MLYLLKKPHQYLLVWSFLYANSNAEGVYSDNYQNLLAQFKVSRSTLQRIIEFGCGFEASGQKMGRKWAGKELIIIFITEDGGQKMGRKWAEKKVNAEQNGGQPLKGTVQQKNQDKQVSNSYLAMVKEYDLFCISYTGMGAKMDAMQGNSMKQIIKYLSSQVINKKGGNIGDAILMQEIIAAWKFILANWSVLDTYYSKQIKLNQINSNLPNILTQLRNNKQKLRNEKFANSVIEVERINFEEHDH
jgi:hypothetical protein